MKEQPELVVTEYPVEDLVPYANNANIHSNEQIAQIEASIEEFGFCDPVGVWENADGAVEIIEGHGRVMAAKNLGMETVPVIFLNALSDEQRRAYTHVHNQLTRNSECDWETLEREMEDLPDFDWEALGFEGDDDVVVNDPYTKETNIPHYEVTGEVPELSECYDCDKYKALCADIDTAMVSNEEREFLKLAAARHIVFNYAKIAEYYAQASAETQRQMEKSALVIIDFDDAIKYGYTDLSEAIEEIAG